MSSVPLLSIPEHRANAAVANTKLDFLAGGGELGELIRAFDWSQTPIGPCDGWSLSLRMMVSFLLANRFPLLLWWGPQYISIYNDAYRPVLGAKHPWALGQPCSQCWGEIWRVLKPLIDAPFSGGPPAWMEDLELEVHRHGFIEETHFTIAYSPVPDEAVESGIGGVLATVHEITEKVIGERRIAALAKLGARAAEAKTAEAACVAACEMLATVPKDVPFAAIYLVDGTIARRVAATGFSRGTASVPDVIHLSDEACSTCLWPIAEVLRTEAMLTIEDLSSVNALPPGPWSDPPRSAVLVPIRSNAVHQLAGVLVAGVSPRLQLSDQYRSFFELSAAQIATAIAKARAYEEERRRAEALAEIDRAKTAFFSNVSHEFRTPLTLILGPVEEAAANPAIPEAVRAQLTLAQRNSLRLLKLVNSLLDFSRIEAGRVQASYAPTDLASATRDLASTFRSAMERAGLSYRVECEEIGELVYIDQGMWEKIVLNLLSNAFKFTLHGSVAVSLRRHEDTVVFEVTDTGVGIPKHELPRLFERFHRIEGTAGRSQEGSGIGLALVQELVKLHGGTVTAASEPGAGTSFRVALPLGSAHLPAERIRTAPAPASTAVTSQAFVQEALRWIPTEPTESDPEMQRTAAPADRFAATAGARILLADDNADMRAYVRDLLSPFYRIETVSDGVEALAAARRGRPDLILSDIMMPRMDGLALLKALRSENSLRDIPLVLLSARAGEECRVEGLDAGADDYLVKPFSARELLARIGALLELTKMRKQTGQSLREREEQLRLATEAAEIGLWDVDLVADTLFWPPRVKAMFGISPDVPVSMADFYAGLHPEDRQRTSEAFAAALDPEQRALYSVEYRTVGKEDGLIRWVAAKGRGIFDGGRCVRVIGTAIDITERKQAEKALRESEARLSAELMATQQLQTISAQLIHDQNAETLYQELVDAAAVIMRSDFATMQTLHPERGSSGELHLLASHGLDAEAVKFWEWVSADSGCTCGAVLRTGHRAIASDVETCDWMAGTPDRTAYLNAGIRAAQSTPLISRSGRLLGMISTHWRAPHEPPEADLQRLDILGRLAADLLERVQADAALRESRETLKRAHAELKSGMAELARFAQAATGREKRVIELKEEVNSLRERMGESACYSLTFDEELAAPAEHVEPQGEGLVPLESILRTDELRARPSRRPDYAAETRAIASLMEALAESPRSILDTLAETTLQALHAGSAGLSLLTQDRRSFYWAAIAGQWSPHIGGGTPRGFGPCGDVLDRNVPLLFTHWEQRYPYLAAATPLAEEALLVPFHVRGQRVGTIWVIAHDPERRFDTEDLRLLESLGRFAALAYQAVEFLGALDQRRAALNLLEDAVQARQLAEDANRRLRDSEEALEQINRRKDEFLAMLAHELRNPLAPIANAAALLSRTASGDARSQAAVEMIKRQMTQLTRLVDDLLDVSRVTQGRIQLRKKPTELATIITQAIETVEPQLREKRHRLSVTASSYGPLYVLGDFARLVQCVGNLLTNAAKYTEPGGEISVRTDADEANLFIEVTDTGMGIAPELLPRVFDLFVQSERTLDRAQGGLGIGLAVVKRLVEMHDGEITARSEGPGRGSSFRIRVPRIDSPVQEENAALPMVTEPRRVMIVDDNADAANSLAMLLAMQGHETEVAYAAKDALARVEAFRPEVALLDIGLPEMDGYELAKRLRAMPLPGNVRMIALTGYGQSEDRQRALSAGFSGHVVKPVDFSALERAIAGAPN